MRIHLANTLESRDGTLAKDARLKNAVVEVIEGQPTVVKRPGVGNGTTVVSGGGVAGQGLFGFGGKAYSIIDDTLYSYVVATEQGSSGGGTSIISTTNPFVTPVSTSRTQIHPGSLFISGSTMYFMAWPNTYSSTDGINWSSTAWTGVDQPPGPADSLIFLLYNGAVYCFDENQTVTFKTTNGAFTAWTLLGTLSLFSEIDEYIMLGATVLSFLNGAISSSTDFLNFTSVGDNLPNKGMDNIISFGGYIWSLGGQSSPAVHRSADGVTWTQMTADWGLGNLFGYAKVVHNGKIVIAGGRIGSVNQNTAYESADGITWTLTAFSGAFTARTAAQMVSLGGSLYIVGGNTGHRNETLKTGGGFPGYGL